MKDALGLARSLIRCPSITPRDEGALDVLRLFLEPYGFEGRDLIFSDRQEGPQEKEQESQQETVRNFYAYRRGEASGQGRHLCFAGHVDVVPPGCEESWRHPPFAAEIEDGLLFGRGACDMKTAIACFAAAVGQFLEDCDGKFPGKLSFLITSDEEGRAVNGTVKMLEALSKEGEEFEACLVGEPTNRDVLGEMMKIGRRGSLRAHLTVSGIQGHVAYPDQARNPIPELIVFLNRLLAEELDQGNQYFEPSHIEITSIDVGNPAGNVIPARAQAWINIRFNDQHSGATLRQWLEAYCRSELTDYHLDVIVNSESFISTPGSLCDILSRAVYEITGHKPQKGTSGGTSDARFIRLYCPVVEFGLVGKSMHQVDEHVSLQDITNLTAIYRRFLEIFFAT